jgi:phosphoribosylformylglycinamidine cyclo-ligase
MTINQETNHYKAAGVDTDAGDAVVDWLQASKEPFKHPQGFGQVLDGIGGFAGLFSINSGSMKQPTLVASTDGVGTKLILGLDHNHCQNLGQDLVAMCVNDLYTVGASPLFFLDYYATGQLNPDQFKDVLTSIQNSCKQCGMALLGGETAEMPGLYHKGHFDLAGFVVGIVDQQKRLGPHRVSDGDVLISLNSTGFHSNGYSLIRKWLNERPRPDLTEKLLAPTALYSCIPKLIDIFPSTFKACANITGGGISGNLPRVLPENSCAEIKFSDLPTPLWMKSFIESNDASILSVEPVFNLGVGMIAVIDPNETTKFINELKQYQIESRVIGMVHTSRERAHVRYI